MGILLSNNVLFVIIFRIWLEGIIRIVIGYMGFIEKEKILLFLNIFFNVLFYGGFF